MHHWNRIRETLHRRWFNAQSGQGLAEYALILALIAVIAIAALLFMGSQVSDKLSVIGSSLDGVTP